MHYWLAELHGAFVPLSGARKVKNSLFIDLQSSFSQVFVSQRLLTCNCQWRRKRSGRGGHGRPTFFYLASRPNLLH